jgi:molybdate transport system substrate-binding protein
MMAARGILAIAMLAGAVQIAAAADIRVYSTGAPAEAVKAIAVDFTHDTGHHVSLTVGQPVTIEGDLAAGDKADVVILPAPVVAMLNGTGALRTGSVVDVARVGIGVVVRDGAPRPDIADAAALRGLLLKARSIVYPDPVSGGGSAGRAIARMIDRMGLTDTVRGKLTLASAIGGGVERVAGGEAEVGFFNLSEIVPIKGVTLVGPLPAELPTYIVFDAAIPKSDPAPEPAAAFIKRLADPAARPAWQSAGLEPVAADQR